MEELELASPDEPIAERLESWADSPESEIFSDLREGPELSRERAAEIVARGAEYLPDLIELECEETPSHEKWAAVWLVGAIGDPSAVPVLKALLVDPSSCDLATMLGSVADGAGRALAEMGPAGAEALFDLLARRQAREVILESMSTLATRQPDLRPRVASACLEVLADQAAPEMTRYLAVKTLIDLNWREALPVIERLLNRGQLDVDMIGPESIEEWRLAPAGLPQHPRRTAWSASHPSTGAMSRPTGPDSGANRGWGPGHRNGSFSATSLAFAVTLSAPRSGATIPVRAEAGASTRSATWTPLWARSFAVVRPRPRG